MLLANSEVCHLIWFFFSLVYAFILNNVFHGWWLHNIKVQATYKLPLLGRLSSFCKRKEKNCEYNNSAFITKWNEGADPFQVDEKNNNKTEDTFKRLAHFFYLIFWNCKAAIIEGAEFKILYLLCRSCALQSTPRLTCTSPGGFSWASSEHSLLASLLTMSSDEVNNIAW